MPSNGSTEKYVYDGQDVVRDLNADGSVAAEYLNGPGIDNKIRQIGFRTTRRFLRHAKNRPKSSTKIGLYLSWLRAA